MTEPIIQNTVPTSTTPAAPTPSSPAAENLDAFLAKAESSPKISTWGYIAWGWTLPPISTVLALIIAIKRGAFFVVLPTLTIAFSLLAIISPVIIYFLFGPIHIVTTQFTINQNIYADPKLAITSMLLTFLAIAGVVLGIYFRKRAKQTLTLGPVPITVLLLILALEHVIVWMNISSAMAVISKQAQIILNQQGVPF